MSSWSGLAERSLDGHAVTADEAFAILQARDDDLLPLLKSAFLF